MQQETAPETPDCISKAVCDYDEFFTHQLFPPATTATICYASHSNAME
jgi:hypothetical protein